jgi:hypothetical protein
MSANGQIEGFDRFRNWQETPDYANWFNRSACGFVPGTGFKVFG